MRTGGTHLSLVLFFLKTFFFNPLNNPVFVISAVFLVFFYSEGSLDKHHVVLVVYLSILAHYRIGNMFGDTGRNEEREEKPPVIRYLRALPLSGREIYLAYFSSSAVYALALLGVLVLLLKSVLQPPDWFGVEYIRSVGADGDTITKMVGFACNARGVPRFMSVILERSFLFDTARGIRGGAIVPFVYLLLVFLYVSVFQVYRQFRERNSRAARFIHSLPFTIYLLMGLPFGIELILSQKETGEWINYFLSHRQIVQGSVLAASLFTLLSTYRMSENIIQNLEERCR